jgi:hypothetical protein
MKNWSYEFYLTKREKFDVKGNIILTTFNLENHKQDAPAITFSTKEELLCSYEDPRELIDILKINGWQHEHLSYLLSKDCYIVNGKEISLSGVSAGV